MKRKRNQITSMSGNMWAALRWVRSGKSGFTIGGARRLGHYKGTIRALHDRGLLETLGSDERQRKIYRVSPLGRMICDAYLEGREAGR